jgi:hypothetical protein
MPYGNFLEIYRHTSLEIAEALDPKAYIKKLGWLK